jgi:hypothetical protein
MILSLNKTVSSGLPYRVASYIPGGGTHMEINARRAYALLQVLCTLTVIAACISIKPA